MPIGESAARHHQAGVTIRDGNGDPGRYGVAAPRLETARPSGIEIDPAITGMCPLRHGKICIEPFEQYPHHDDYAPGRRRTLAERRRVDRSTIIGRLETTPATVPRARDSHAPDEALPDEDLGWEPRPLESGARSSRTFRWSVILMALTLGVGAVFLVQIALGIPERRAETRRAEYQASLQDLATVTPDVAVVADLITNPRESGIVQGLVTVVQLDDRAEWVHSVASRDLPSVPPLLPAGPLDDLADIRDRMLAIVDRAETISARLSDTISYRLAFERAFQLPPLPLSATEAAAQEAGTSLTMMLADSVEAAANLPDDDFLRAHRGQVDILIGWFTDWQAEYLLALRVGDSGRADQLLSEARQRIVDLGNALVQPLDDMDSWATEAIADLDARIEEALLLLGD